MCNKANAVMAGEATLVEDPVVKALAGETLTPDERAAAADEVRRMEETLGEPPAEIVEKLEEAGVDVPVVGGDDGI